MLTYRHLEVLGAGIDWLSEPCAGRRLRGRLGRAGQAQLPPAAGVQEAGLKCSGKTEELVERLAEHLEQSAASPATDSTPAEEEMRLAPAAPLPNALSGQQKESASRPKKRKRTPKPTASESSGQSVATSTSASPSGQPSTAKASSSGAGHVGNCLGSFNAPKSRGLNVSGKWWKHRKTVV